MKNILLCVINALLLVSGQILFRYGVKGRVLDSVPAVMGAVFTPFVLLGLMLYACSTILWLYILSKIPISFAYPIQALAFPLVLIIAALAFKETIPISRWVGVGVILVGVVIAAK
jgi:drug/metabolite transporter (DMT)-like permease